MNREILFKAKRIDNGEWVEGFYFREIGDFIKRLPSAVSTLTHLVDPNTIGQYTGLTDKNGTKIFEGDIVKHGYLNKYCQERLTAKYIVKWGKCGFGTALACITEQEICEVIGNIHEGVAE